MKWVLWIAAGLALLVLVVAIVGWLLPVAHVATRSAEYRYPRERVFAAISDVQSYAAWWSEVSKVEMLGSQNGRLRFREHTSNGPIVFEVEEASAPSRMVTRIADPDQPFGGTWTFEVEPRGEHTRLTITERGEVYNPIFRFMSRFVFSQTATMESFLSALGQSLG
jgi:uncharacterized protein YndB with AHSA1/START domain